MVGNNIYPSRDFSDKELKLSALITSHFDRIKLIGVIALVLLDVIFFGLFLKGIYTYAVTYEQTENAINLTSVQEIDWPSIRQVIRPKSLVSESVNIFSSENATDFISRVRNSNETRWGEFEYRFTWADGSTEWNKTFILPNASKYVLALGIEDDTPGVVGYEVRNLKWHTMDKTTKERFELTRNSITVIESTFVPNVNKEFTGVPSSGVEFLVENRSPFDLQNIPFTILLTNGATFTAANRATLSRLDRGEKRLIRTRWVGVVGGGQVIIEPDINFLDDAVIAPTIDKPSDVLF